MSGHIPVLRDAAVAALDPKPGETHLDATFGGGGYAHAILDRGADVIAVDRDPAAIARAQALATAFPGRVEIAPGAFSVVIAALAESGRRIDGVAFDFGVSSFQFDEAERGFSFRFDAALDMRMGDGGFSAADAVNRLSDEALAQAIYAYGEEPASRRIARAIIAARPVRRTVELAALVEKALGGRRGAKTHPATATFQALRMLVNDELGEIARGLSAAEQILKPGGRLAIVAFHSLEDRLAKSFLTSRTGGDGEGSRHRPPTLKGPPASFALAARKSMKPSEAEIAANPRARSARLRAATRTSASVMPAFDWTDPAPMARRAWESLQ